MSCTRLYVDPTEALVIQSSKYRLICLQSSDQKIGEVKIQYLSLSYQRMAMKNSKRQKETFKEAENWIRRVFLSTFCYHQKFPSYSFYVSFPSYAPPPQSPTYFYSLLFSVSLTPLIGIGTMIIKKFATSVPSYSGYEVKEFSRQIF